MRQLRHSSTSDWAAITSLYFDNDDLDVYAQRLKKAEGASLIRLRWYGHSWPPSEVWVERKTHHEPWTGDRSLKVGCWLLAQATAWH